MSFLDEITMEMAGNVDDTFKEQEIGDFHVSYKQLEEAIKTATNMYEENNRIYGLYFKIVSLGNQINSDYSDLIDTSFVSSMINSIDIDTFKESNDSIKELNEKLANYIKTIRESSQEADYYFKRYMTDFLNSKVNDYNDGDDVLSAYTAEFIFKNYMGASGLDGVPFNEQIKFFELLAELHPELIDDRNIFEKGVDWLEGAVDDVGDFFDDLGTSFDVALSLAEDKADDIAYKVRVLGNATEAALPIAGEFAQASAVEFITPFFNIVEEAGDGILSDVYVVCEKLYELTGDEDLHDFATCLRLGAQLDASETIKDQWTRNVRPFIRDSETVKMFGEVGEAVWEKGIEYYLEANLGELGNTIFNVKRNQGKAFESLAASDLDNQQVADYSIINAGAATIGGIIDTYVDDKSIGQSMAASTFDPLFESLYKYETNGNGQNYFEFCLDEGILGDLATGAVGAAFSAKGNQTGVEESLRKQLGKAAAVKFAGYETKKVVGNLDTNGDGDLTDTSLAYFRLLSGALK